MAGATRGGRGGRRRGAGRKSTLRPPCQADTIDPPLTNLIANVTSSLSAAQSFLHQHDLLLLPSQTLTLESHLSVSRRSLSSLSSFLLPSAPPPPPPLPLPADCWFDRLLSSSKDDHDPRWPDFFRMSKPTFSLLFAALSPALLSSLPPTILPTSALSAAVYRLAHSASYDAIARRFGLSSSADACRAFYTVCKLICDHLSELFEFRSDLERIVLGFGWISLPNCFGVLGASHFPVSGKLQSLIVQALVDSEGRFLDVSAGWPATINPKTAFTQTTLFRGVEQSKELLNGPHFKLTDGNSVPQYLIGDSCYPLLPWLLTPYPPNGDSNDMSLNQVVFNEVHRRAMGILRKAFVKLKRLWRLLDRQWKIECVEFMPNVIMACCLLYNLLVKHGEPLPDVDDMGAEQESGYDADEEVENEDGKRVRDAIALHLCRFTQR